MKTSVKKPIIKRKKHSKWENIKFSVLRFLVLCLVIPCYYGWKGLVWFYDMFLTEVYESGSNGVFGPGGYSWEHKRFSWGKLSFIIVLIILILVITYII